MSVDVDFARGRRVQKPEDIHERALARARRAYDGGEVRFFDGYRYAVQYAAFADGLMEVPAFQYYAHTLDLNISTGKSLEARHDG